MIREKRYLALLHLRIIWKVKKIREFGVLPLNKAVHCLLLRCPELEEMRSGYPKIDFCFHRGRISSISLLEIYLVIAISFCLSLSPSKDKLEVVADSVEIMENFREALSPHPQGLTIRFEVSPGSSELRVPSGFNPWRKTLGARLTEQPHKGRANQQLIEEVARILGIPERNVEVLSGHKSERKVLLVTGLDLDSALSSLTKPR